MNNAPRGKSLQTLRNELRQSSAHRFVTTDEFCALMISNSSLQRIEIPAAQVIGLLNLETGITYLVESELLGTDRTW